MKCPRCQTFNRAHNPSSWNKLDGLCPVKRTSPIPPQEMSLLSGAALAIASAGDSHGGADAPSRFDLAVARWHGARFVGWLAGEKRPLVGQPESHERLTIALKFGPVERRLGSAP